MQKLTTLSTLAVVALTVGCSSTPEAPTDKEIITRMPFEDRSAHVFSKVSTIYCADKVVTAFYHGQYFGYISCGYPGQMAAKYTFQTTDLN